MDLNQRCRNIEFILSDVDGVLTDGGIIYDNQGIETKRFHVRDGLGIRLWRRSGGRIGLLTSRSSHIVKLRATELHFDIVRQGFEDKLPAAQQIFQELNLEPDQVCYIGDDLPDLPVIRYVGMGVAVNDACQEVSDAAVHTTEHGGGQGAVRETIEFILQAKGLWSGLISTYTGQ